MRRTRAEKVMILTVVIAVPVACLFYWYAMNAGDFQASPEQLSISKLVWDSLEPEEKEVHHQLIVKSGKVSKNDFRYLVSLKKTLLGLTDDEVSAAYRQGGYPGLKSILKLHDETE